MTENKPRHMAYLLRMWLVDEEVDPMLTPEVVWRVSLEDVTTHIRYGFASLDRAFAFLHQHMVPEKEEYDDQE